MGRCYWHRIDKHVSDLSQPNCCTTIKDWAASYPSFVVPTDKLPVRRTAPPNRSANASTPGTPVPRNVPSAGRRLAVEEDGAASAGVACTPTPDPMDARKAVLEEINSDIGNNNDDVTVYSRSTTINVLPSAHTPPVHYRPPSNHLPPIHTIPSHPRGDVLADRTPNPKPRSLAALSVSFSPSSQYIPRLQCPVPGDLFDENTPLPLQNLFPILPTRDSTKPSKTSSYSLLWAPPPQINNNATLP